MTTTETTIASITFQQANTTDGSYNVRASLPYPVTVEAGRPRRAYIGHPTNRGADIGVLIGFVPDPASFDPKYTTGLPHDPEDIVSMFPVYNDGKSFYTDTRVIERIVSTTTAEADGSATA